MRTKTESLNNYNKSINPPAYLPTSPFSPHKTHSNANPTPVSPSAKKPNPPSLPNPLHLNYPNQTMHIPILNPFPNSLSPTHENHTLQLHSNPLSLNNPLSPSSSTNHPPTHSLRYNPIQLPPFHFDPSLPRKPQRMHNKHPTHSYPQTKLYYTHPYPSYASA